MLKVLFRTIPRRSVMLGALGGLLPILFFGFFLFSSSTESSLLAKQKGLLRKRLDLQTQIQTQERPHKVSLYVLALPYEAASLPLLSTLRRAAESQGVELLSVSAKEQAGTPAAMGLMTIEVSLRGRYGPVKAMLAELTAPTTTPAVLQTLQFHRVGNGPELDAKFVLTWPSRPRELTKSAAWADPMAQARPGAL